MRTGSALDRVTSVVLTIATVIALGFLVEARLNAPQAEVGSGVVTNIEDWESSLAMAEISLGNTAGPVKVAVFTDFECPFCKRMDSALTALEAKHVGSISRSVLHFPIPTHRHARPAALAFDCAAAQGRAAQMHHSLYGAQDSLSNLRWESLAAESGVPNLGEFVECMARDTTSVNIDFGIELAKGLEVNGTPTVVVNGWLFHSPLPAAIESAVNAVLAGKSPKP